MSKLRIGIVGTGMIGGVMARALAHAEHATLAAVASRNPDRARQFVAEVGAGDAAGSWQDLIDRADVDAVYVATPTSEKEPIALAAMAAGKHVLVDKPFTNTGSVERMLAATKDPQVAFMDATHFAHHPRTAAIQNNLDQLVGTPLTLHTSFHFPGDNPRDIRRQPALEPMGALGDMGWYAMRAIVEYLRPRGDVETVSVTLTRDDGGAVVQAAGMLTFADGRAATFDVGYRVGALVQDLSLLGTGGSLAMDDFVLDRQSSFAFDNPDAPASFTHRAGADGKPEPRRQAVPSATGQHVLMLDAFAMAARDGDGIRHGQASLATQRLLDAVWAAAR